MKKFYRKLTAAAVAAIILLFSVGALAATVKTLTLPSKLQRIEAYAFYGDMSLEKVVIPEGVTEIGEKAFADSSVTRVSLPAGAISIAEHAFDAGHYVRFDTVLGSDGDQWVSQHQYPRVQTGSNSIDISAGKVSYLRYTAGISGEYDFYTNGSEDTYGSLYDLDFNELAENDNDGKGDNFKISCTLAAGQTVLVGVEYNSVSLSGSETLCIDRHVYLSAGTNKVPVSAGEITIGYYTAGTAGEYTFCTTGKADTYGCLYDSDMNLLAEDDNSGENTNFKITCTLSAGQPVYLNVKYVSASDSGTVPVVITAPKASETGTVYRALLIGQVSFDPPLNSTWADVLRMEKLLKTVNGGQYAITKKKDLTKNKVKEAISSAFKGADEDDVSLIFYSSHGVTDEGYFYGALWTYDDDLILTEELAEWLSDVPGKVIVLVDTCGSGALIGKGDGETKGGFDPEAFDVSLIRAFEEADSRLVARSGELAAGKFYVMTSSMGGESSWGEEGNGTDGSFGYFTHWLYEGAGGTKTAMPADTNGNRCLTLNEWYTYVKNRAALETFTEDGVDYYQQHPQVYPTDSDYVIFTK